MHGHRSVPIFVFVPVPISRRAFLLSDNSVLQRSRWALTVAKIPLISRNPSRRAIDSDLFDLLIWLFSRMKLFWVAGSYLETGAGAAASG